jgi:hypothetical protein
MKKLLNTLAAVVDRVVWAVGCFAIVDYASNHWLLAYRVATVVHVGVLCSPISGRVERTMSTTDPGPNKAPAPNRRPRFPLGAAGAVVHYFSAPPASPAAVGEARR